MLWKEKYEEWLSCEKIDVNLKNDLLNLNEEEIKESFHSYLQFGTGGMRGIIGPGINRMNIYTIRKAALGLGNFIVQKGREPKRRGVVIAYDSRHQSKRFAQEVAKTLGYLSIKVYLFASLRSTPELSFAVQYLNAYSGVMITASHNPKQYNGFKIFNEDGAQYSAKEADSIINEVDKIQKELMVQVAPLEKLKNNNMLNILNEEVDLAYLKKLQGVIHNKKAIHVGADQIKIVYTPLHGAGYRVVVNGLNLAGFKQVYVVEEQANPDPDFSTVSYPNPEDPASFELAIKYGKACEADLLLATDPDSDRLGVAVKNKQNYKILSGNQIGVLLLYYLLNQKKKLGILKENSIVVKTIVTSELGRRIAATFNVETIDVLTGFKYIGEKIKECEEKKKNTFLFGYEESHGYLIEDFVRDKDAVQACLLMAEAAAYYKTKSQSLMDVLYDIYDLFGFYVEEQEAIQLTGLDGEKRMVAIMDYFRHNDFTSIGGYDVLVKEDYLNHKKYRVKEAQVEEIHLPKTNVIKYKLEGEAWICLRPSGTEPLIKFYFGSKGSTEDQGIKILQKLKQDIFREIDKL